MVRYLRVLVFLLFASALALPIWKATTVESQSATEAPTGMDTLTNGFVTQAVHDGDRATFEERDIVTDGLGPIYNAQSCAECHQNPVTGGISQISELRAGHNDGFGNFVPATLTINDGGGLTGITIANGALRIGRFGWKSQDASLLTFAGGAYLNEMGITNRFNLQEVTTLCDDVPDNTPCTSNPQVICGEDKDNDIDAFARFMRATKAPSRDSRLAATSSAQAGASLFHSIGCDVCHMATLTTAPAGTLINGGAFTVPAALGNKNIHPYSDFLLHDVGSGDGIAQVIDPNTGQLDQTMKNKMRTAPLWGVRTRNELMHDGENYTRNEAILRHANEANGVINSYRALSTTQKNQIVDFLNSL